MKNFKKISLLLFALLATLVLSACGGEDAQEDNNGENTQATDKVVIGVYGGDWEKNIRQVALDKFEEETGIDVEVVAGADAEWFAKLKVANGQKPPYDVLILQPDTIQRGIASNLLQPIDTEKAPNVKDLYQSIQERFTVDDNVYAAGFSMGQLGLAYRKDLVEKEPTAWLDLWDPAYKGKVALSSPTYSAGLQFFSGLVNAMGGKESNSEDVDAAFNKLAELKDSVVAYPDSSGSIQTLLERGDAAVVPFWDGRIFALQEAGLDLGFAYPEEGAVAAIASWAITKGSPNMENAHKLVNYLSSPEVQKEFSDLSYYGMSNKNIEYSDHLKDKIKVGEEEYSQLKWVDYEVSTPKLADWTNQWKQTMGGGQ